jgi:expansin (peptidoglycan-binding protein)
MRGLITIALLVALGEASASPAEQVISVQHDSSRAVTCWITPQGGISCLPDNQLAPLPQAATLSSHTGRASTASSGYENGTFPAAPLPQDERLQL